MFEDFSQEDHSLDIIRSIAVDHPRIYGGFIPVVVVNMMAGQLVRILGGLVQLSTGFQIIHVPGKERYQFTGILMSLVKLNEQFYKLGMVGTELSTLLDPVYEGLIIRFMDQIEPRQSSDQFHTFRCIEFLFKARFIEADELGISMLFAVERFHHLEYVDVIGRVGIDQFQVL